MGSRNECLGKAIMPFPVRSYAINHFLFRAVTFSVKEANILTGTRDVMAQKRI
jgi:hypothetical protein